MSIRILVEGSTEESLIRHLEPMIGQSLLPINVGGKGNLARAIGDRLGPALDEPGGARFVILRDRDRGEEWQGIQRSIQGAIQKAFSEAGYTVPVQFAPHLAYPNVFTSQHQQPPARFALHVARSTADTDGLQFAKSTTDDYVLTLALLPSVTERFIQQAKVSLDVDGFRRKVLDEMPDLLAQNGIPLDEAKDLIGVYMATARFLATRRSERPETFTGIVVDRALKYAAREIEQVLASLLEAIRFAAREEGER